MSVMDTSCQKWKYDIWCVLNLDPAENIHGVYFETTTPQLVRFVWRPGTNAIECQLSYESKLEKFGAWRSDVGPVIPEAVKEE